MKLHTLLRGCFAVLAAALLASPPGPAGAQDATFGPKIYRDNGGDRMSVKAGGEVKVYANGQVNLSGKQTVESGGEIEVASGATLSVKSGSTLSVESGATWDFARAGVQRTFSHGCKAGATAGWVVAAGHNLSLATLPAESTAATMVCALTGLKVGDTITAFSLVGQIESAGGAVTLDANLRKLTAAAADVTDASVGSITQVAASADAIVSAAKSGLSEVVAADETFYILITGTTAAATDIALQGFTVTVTES